MREGEDETAFFHNPLLPNGPDPWMVWHDGYYYLTRTGGKHLRMRRARSIVDL